MRDSKSNEDYNNQNLFKLRVTAIKRKRNVYETFTGEGYIKNLLEDFY